MLSIMVNGTPIDIGDGATAIDVVQRWCRSVDGVAVAVNGDVVPRSRWSTQALRNGDRVEIVTAAAGG